MFKSDDYFPFITGLFALGGLVIVPLIWGALGDLGYARAIPGSLLGCAVFAFAHTRKGEFKVGRLIAAMAVAFLLIVRTSGPGQGSPLILPGGALGYFVMAACGWAGIGTGRLLGISRGPSRRDEVQQGDG